MTLPSASREAETGPTAPAGGLMAGRREADRRKKLAAWVREQYEEARRARGKFERQWYLNLQFYRGNQNVEFRRIPTATTGYKLGVPPAPPHRVRLVINRIRPMIRKERAKLTAQRPTFIVVPATQSDEDHASARVAEQVLEARYTDLRVARAQRLALWWASICGTGFLKDYWDKGKGPMQPGPMGGAMPAGDSCVEAVDPFHIFVPDLREPDIENQPWVIHAATHDREYVRTYFGIDAVGTAVPSTELFTDDLLIGSGAPKPKDQVLVLECWLRPGAHPDFPAGGLVTVVGERVYVEHQGPVYQHGELPFVKLDMIESGGFYAESSITDLVPIQRLYNRQRSQIVESGNLMGRPKWLAPTGAITASKISSEPGQVVEYQQLGPKPEMVAPPPLPEYVSAGPEQALKDMDDISGQHEISRGQQPGQVTAATAISYLQEQDDTLLSDAVFSLEEGMAKLGRHLLSHVLQFFAGERLMMLVGEDGSFDAVQLSASVLRGNTDVRVQAGSALPASRAARQATSLELFKLGLFGPPGEDQTNKKMLEVLDMSGMEKVLSDWRIDERQAQRENTKMSQGVPCEIHPYDNHVAHIVVHNRFRKGQRFETLDPAIQEMFGQHVLEHERANMTQQMVAAAAGMGPAGPPGSEGDQAGAPGGGGPDPGAMMPADAGPPTEG